MPIAKNNEPPVAGARCVNCGNELGTRYVTDTLAHTETRRDFIGYYCADENCKLHGWLTVRYRLPAGEAIPSEPALPAKKS